MNFSLLFFTQKSKSIRKINTQSIFVTATVAKALLAPRWIATEATSFGDCCKRQILCYSYFTTPCKCQTVKNVHEKHIHSVLSMAVVVLTEKFMLRVFVAKSYKAKTQRNT